MADPLARFRDETQSTDPLARFRDGAQPEPQSSGALGTLKDIGITGLKSAIGVPEAALGLADIVTSGRTGKTAENLGFRPKEAKEILSSYYSPEQQAKQQAVRSADGFLPTLKSYAQNPSVAAHDLGEQIAPILGGGVLAQGVRKVLPKVAPYVAGAIGEGALTAGQNIEQVRQETPGGLLDPMKQTLPIVASGALTGAIAAGSGRIADKLGITDIQNVLAGGQTRGGKGIVKNILGTTFLEGVGQELPQSMQEQVAQNYALEKPLTEGVGTAAAQGLVLGSAMGAGGAIIDPSNYRKGPLTNAQTQPPAPQWQPPGYTDTKFNDIRRPTWTEPSYANKPNAPTDSNLSPDGQPGEANTAAPRQAMGGSGTGIGTVGENPTAKQKRDLARQQLQQAPITNEADAKFIQNRIKILDAAPDEKLDAAIDTGIKAAKKRNITLPEITNEAELPANTGINEKSNRDANKKGLSQTGINKAEQDITSNQDGLLEQPSNLADNVAQAVKDRIEQDPQAKPKDIINEVSNQIGQVNEEQNAIQRNANEETRQRQEKITPTHVLPDYDNASVKFDEDFGWVDTNDSSVTYPADSFAEPIKNDQETTQAQDQATQARTEVPVSGDTRRPSGVDDIGTGLLPGGLSESAQGEEQPDLSNSGSGVGALTPDLQNATQTPTPNNAPQPPAPNQDTLAERVPTPSAPEKAVDTGTVAKELALINETKVRIKNKSISLPQVSQSILDEYGIKVNVTPDKNGTIKITLPSKHATQSLTTLTKELRKSGNDILTGATENELFIYAKPRVTKTETPETNDPMPSSLMAMPLDTKEDAEAYIKAHKRYLDLNGSGGTHQPRPASWKPPSVRNPETFTKLEKAWDVAGMNYWQMPYEEAIKLNRFKGLPKSKWESARKERNLPLQETLIEQETRETEKAPQGQETAAKAKRLDHGELNIPGRTNNINVELDQYKTEQSAQEKVNDKANLDDTRRQKAEISTILADKDFLRRKAKALNKTVKDVEQAVNTMTYQAMEKFIEAYQKEQQPTKQDALKQKIAENRKAKEGVINENETNKQDSLQKTDSKNTSNDDEIPAIYPNVITAKETETEDSIAKTDTGNATVSDNKESSSTIGTGQKSKLKPFAKQVDEESKSLKLKTPDAISRVKNEVKQRYEQQIKQDVAEVKSFSKDQLNDIADNRLEHLLDRKSLTVLGYSKDMQDQLYADNNVAPDIKDESKPQEAKATETSMQKNAADLANDMQKMRNNKPRSLKQLFGKTGPTLEQKAAHEESEKKWNAAYRKLSKLQKETLEKENAEFREKNKPAQKTPESIAEDVTKKGEKSNNDVKFSKGFSTGSTRADLINRLDANDKKLLQSGRLNIVQSVSDIPKSVLNTGDRLTRKNSVPAWHGSPHDHNKFDSSKIGTGEGAQAFGYGHYFTDKKEIGEWYKDKLSARELLFDGMPVEDVDFYDFKYDPRVKYFVEAVNRRIKRQKQAVDDAIKAEIQDSSFYNDDLIYFRKFGERLSEKTNGKLYQVELAPEQNEFLDWDKPLSEQSDKVKDAFLKMANENKNFKFFNQESKKILQGESLPQFLMDFGNSQGKYIYKNLSETLSRYPDADFGDPSSDKAASDLLHKYGIRGIRYKAEAGKSDAYNYVIFSDDDISIKEKYSKDEQIEGFYKDGKIYIIADNVTPENLPSVLLHEKLHASLDQNPKLRERVLGAQSELNDIFDQVESGQYTGRYKELYDAAMKRVDRAKTAPDARREEFFAYAVSVWEKSPQSLPARLAKAIADMVAAIKAAIFRYSGYIGKISPSDLSALAVSSMNYSKSSNGSNAVAMASKQGYKGNDAGEAEEWLRAKAKGLDMSQEARMERAKAMGFDVDTVWYHGTRREFDSFNITNPRGAIGNKKGAYFTKDKRIAEEYSEDVDGAIDEKSRIIPVYLKNPEIKNSLTFGDEAIISDPNSIRSIYAAFDQDYADSPNLLASKFSVAPPQKSSLWTRWFGKSKMKRGGEPITFYHGTSTDFTVFNKGDTKSTRHPSAELGHFFAEDKGAAAAYGGKIHEVYLSMQNPYIVTSELLDKRMGDDPAKFAAKLKKDGFDGIYIKDAKYAVIFDSNQAKLTSNESPTFGSDIRFSIADDNLAEFKRRSGLGPKKTLVQTIQDILNRGIDANLQIIKDKWTELKPKIEQGVFDKFLGIKLAEKEIMGDVAHSLSGYIGARLSTGSSSTMSAVLQFGAPEWKDGIIQRKENSKGFAEILKPVKDDLENFTAWMVARRADRLFDVGKENNFSRDMIDAGLALKKEGYQKVADEIAALNSSMLDLAQDAGLVDAESRKTWESADYIPFYRLIEEQKNAGPRSKQGLSHQSSGIRMLKGGENPMSDPLGNMMQNWAHLVDAAMKNSALDKTLTNLEGSRFVSSIPRVQFKQALIPKEQIKKLMLESGLPKEVVDLMPAELTQGIAKMWAMQAPTDPDVVRVMRNGKSEYFKVNDPMLLTSLVAVNQSPLPGIFKPMRYMKSLLTGAVTADPTFMARNFIRDSLHSWTIAEEAGFKIGVDSIHGAVKSFKEEGGYIDMMFAGASFQGGYGNYNNPDAAKKSMEAVLRKKGIRNVNGFMDSIVDTPKKYWEMYRSIGDAIENANREAILENAKRAGAEKAQYIFEAKDIMDFSMQGSFTLVRAMSDMLPFFNARLVGLYRLAKAGKTEEARRIILMKGASIAMFSLALLAMNAGNDDYEELEDFDKDQYFHIFVGNQHFRIPKPFELGLIFGTIPERSARALVGKDTLKEYAARLGHGLSDTLAFNPVPQMFKPFVELYSNKNMFTGRPIEGMADEGKLPSARYNEYTSETMRTLSDVLPEALGLSPKRLEHLMHGYTGAMGMYVLGAADSLVRAMSGMPDEPTMRMDRVPVLKAFYQEKPAMHTVYGTQFYDMLRQTEQIQRTINAYKKEGRIIEANELQSENADKLRFRKQLNKTSRSLSETRKKVDMIYRSGISAEQKRERIDSLMNQSNKTIQAIVKKTHPFFN